MDFADAFLDELDKIASLPRVLQERLKVPSGVRPVDAVTGLRVGAQEAGHQAGKLLGKAKELGGMASDATAHMGEGVMAKLNPSNWGNMRMARNLKNEASGLAQKAEGMIEHGKNLRAVDRAPWAGQAGPLPAHGAPSGMNELAARFNRQIGEANPGMWGTTFHWPGT